MKEVVSKEVRTKFIPAEDLGDKEKLHIPIKLTQLCQKDIAKDDIGDNIARLLPPTFSSKHSF
ncbi:hypothetical protein [Desulfopila aestuarii]|uniref:hypothetical protein n=1 Tax=Desulfopila aestuarii TaxID=231440 RepID=UPI0009367D21|nr:hypothetical protein [Desulfopila aestuarii]